MQTDSLFSPEKLKEISAKVYSPENSSNRFLFFKNQRKNKYRHNSVNGDPLSIDDISPAKNESNHGMLGSLIKCKSPRNKREICENEDLALKTCLSFGRKENMEMQTKSDIF